MNMSFTRYGSRCGGFFQPPDSERCGAGNPESRENTNSLPIDPVVQDMFRKGTTGYEQLLNCVIRAAGRCCNKKGVHDEKWGIAADVLMKLEEYHERAIEWANNTTLKEIDTVCYLARNFGNLDSANTAMSKLANTMCINHVYNVLRASNPGSRSKKPGGTASNAKTTVNVPAFDIEDIHPSMPSPEELLLRQGHRKQMASLFCFVRSERKQCSPNGGEYHCHAGVLDWWKGELMGERGKGGQASQNRAYQQIAAHKLGITANQIRTRAKRLVSWFMQRTDEPRPDRFDEKYIKFLEKELRNLGSRSKKHAICRALLDIERDLHSANPPNDPTNFWIEECRKHGVLRDELFKYKWQLRVRFLRTFGENLKYPAERKR